jgi:hypothetical protein
MLTLRSVQSEAVDAQGQKVIPVFSKTSPDIFRFRFQAVHVEGQAKLDQKMRAGWEVLTQPS